MDGFFTTYAATTTFNAKYVFHVPGEPWGTPERPRRARRKASPAPVADVTPAAPVEGSPFKPRPDLQISRGVCGMVAMAYVADLPRLTVTKAYNKTNNTRQKGGTHHIGRMRTLDALGIAYAERPVHGATLSRFASEHAKPGTLYMIRTPRHVVLLKDGWVLDQSGPRPVGKHRHAHKIADSILEILEH